MSKNMSFKQKLGHHSLSIISLFIAIIALTYNTWRSDTTEDNRNIRVAGFELIKQLGSIQNTTHKLHFFDNAEQEHNQLVISGWGNMALIEDLSALLPETVRFSVQQLKQSWQQNSELLSADQNAEIALSKQIAETRTLVRKLLISLD